MAIDPVDGIAVCGIQAAGQPGYEGSSYDFFSAGCKRSLGEEPERHLGHAQRPTRDGHWHI